MKPYRTSRIARFVFASVLALGASGSAFASEIFETIERYDVRGSTYAELLAAMRANGPSAATGGAAHYGVTRVAFRPSYRMRPGPDRCELVSAELDIRIVVVVPRRIGEIDVGATHERWVRLRDDIIRHEEAHAAEARRTWRTMRDELARPLAAPDCKTLQALLDQRFQAQRDAHRERQSLIDR